MRKRFLSIVIASAWLLPAYAQSGQAAEPEHGRIARRRENQQDRVAQGVASGQLTAGETAKLEHKESKLNQEIRNDRKANGGSLTAQERRQINRQQNHISRDIYRDTHNQRKQ